MKKICCIICGKYRKSEKPEISYLLKKILVLTIICSTCKNEDIFRRRKIFLEEWNYLKKKNQLRY